MKRTPPPTPHRILGAAAAASLAVCAVAGAGVAHAHKTVTVSVDGATREISTFARTPAQALADAGVRVGVHDSVTPSSRSRLASGQTITLTRGRAAVLDRGEGADISWIPASTAAKAAAHAHREGAVLPLARSSDLSSLTLGTRRVGIVCDGNEQVRQISPNESVAEVVAAAGIELHPLDRVHLDGAGDVPTIIVTRVSRELTVTEETTGHETRKVEDPNLEEGKEKVVTPGRDGKTRQTTFVEKIDGAPGYTFASQPVTLAQAEEAVVAVGTKKTEPTANTGSAAVPAGAQGSAPSDGVWAALARCESGGNPAAVSSNGLYHGLYQFSVSTWRAVGGTGLPSQASAAEQTHRAQILQSRAGWGQWPACSRSLGLR
ncbi:MAG: transglycosylase family protein [Actinomycetaceae bacterium]|nr:transglycosylase family protein [Actinomycetaceae bacterium]